ncbi:hypothetical protein [Alicyclobacillus acidiphilus]|uniref:hypothetical protein n=1 Tax=Alicyclobacillus acidiphilus TaxID=182455 RepID=UPI00082956C0|nr:hypothetical protein [Alicyclobacillus acidiphilus]
MQGQTHRKPGPPMRNIDEDQLQAWDKENVEKLAVHRDALDRKRTPTAADAADIGEKRNSPLH